MSQGRVELGTSVGYALKEAASALRAAMEEALRPLGLGVTQYSCLEVLAHRPGSSSSDLARATFVTRQSMGSLLQSLERDGLVARATEPAGGRALPTRLTAAGRSALQDASAAVRAVEARMLGGLTVTQEREALQLLRGMVRALQDDAGAD
ncbi:MarR family winged helix-turn-helix transcriptional regulator [Terracoccus luteus]|uniref:DNA-binding MarR family transcriptional regulator n=1 Tax=Terracoccus luteus TaxID=53356 RepID=A0A839PUL6_9MICO|nr:MarR family transcriptional regulator [Terracoccus luteus]MBB2986899.1 DNA-binding MarR family transcriptional regulator [Terracoccus luteus]MCP2172550.1 DNA-binding MarR family transcriptional regulator [Terracoccus luteus]